MARKSQITVIDEALTRLHDQHMVEKPFSDIINDSYMGYTEQILVARALPDARDGLKPSQRRILYAMHMLGLKASGSNAKCARISGETSGKLHPHGNVYPTLMRMAQDWVLREPLIEGQGNLGTWVDPPAAERYTEAKLSRIGEAMLSDLSSDVVDHVATYNDEAMEPVVLPTVFPNLIVNGGSGIAVGVATNMAPHNLREVATLIAAYIDGKVKTVDDILAIMPSPDFPSPCVLRGIEGVRSYYQSGKGTLTLDGIYEVFPESDGTTKIVVTELPHGNAPETLVVELAELNKSKKIIGIKDVKNLTHRKDNKARIKVVIELAKGTNPQVIVNQLLKHTGLRTTFSVNQTVLMDGKVVERTPTLALVKSFVEFREVVLHRKFTNEHVKALADQHIKTGLASASKRIDEVIKLVRSANDIESAQLALVNAGIVSDNIQAKAITSRTLGQLTGLETKKLLEEVEDIGKRIEWLTDKLSDAKKIRKLIAAEQIDLAKKYGNDRRTIIGNAPGALVTEDLIPVEELVVSLTHDGYIKRMPISTYRVQGRGGKGVSGVAKATDESGQIWTGSTHDVFLFFTTGGEVFRKKGHELPLASRTAKGQHLANLLSLAEGEEVAGVISVPSVDADGYIVMTTEGGLIKRTPLREYGTVLQSKGLKAINLRDGDKVAFVAVTSGTSDLFLATQKGYAVRYSEDSVSSTGRATQGVKALTLQAGDKVAQMLTIDPSSDAEILVLTAHGYGKRTPSTAYRTLSGRGAMGVKTIDTVKADKNGLIVGALCVEMGDVVVVMTKKGKVISLRSADISSVGRGAMGVKCVSLDAGDSIAAMTSIKQDKLSASEDTEAEGAE